MTKVYECGNCGAKLDPSMDGSTMRCEFCGTVAEKDLPPSAPASHREPRETETREVSETAKKNRKEKEPKKKKEDPFLFFYLGGLALIGLGTFGYAYLVPSRSVTGKPIVTDVNGDGVEDLLVQWDEEAHSNTTHVIGLIDGKSRKIVWSFTLDAKRRDSSSSMAVGRGYVIVGEPKPVADILDVKTGALKFAIDLPDVASDIFANDMNGWVDTNGKALRVDASTGKTERANGSPVAPDRPAWAPFDSYQGCPHATCRNSAPMPIPDMNVHQVYVDGSSDDAVAVGQKENGTHLPMLAGISLAKKTTRWSRVIPTSTAGTPDSSVIAHARIYFAYTDGNFRHLACASVATGEIVWDVKSEENASQVEHIVVADDVYAERGSTIEHYDPKSGKLVSRFP